MADRIPLGVIDLAPADRGIHLLDLKRLTAPFGQ